MSETGGHLQAQPASKPPASAGDSRARLLGAFQRLTVAGDMIFSAHAQREVESLYRKFQESQFYLVLLGQFKRGKTTLLNALIGTDLLPTGVLPLTSIITKVRFGGRAGAQVRFGDGSTRQIPLEDLFAYVTESGNPKNRKGVAEVEVYYPSTGLQDGLCLVDTPGIGSIFEHNTRVSYDFVPNADAALFVFSPESPLGQAELQFLHHLRAHVEKIFFVLNKADQATDQEQEEILEFARQAIGEQVRAGDLRLYSISARQGLAALKASDSGLLGASGLPSLRASLDRFFASHGKQLLFNTTCGALRRIIRNELLALELEQRALALPTAEMEEKMTAIRQAWKALEERHREAGYVLKGEVAALEHRLETQLNEFVQGEVPGLISHMRQTLRDNRQAPKHALVKALEGQLAERIAEVFEEWKAKEETAVDQAFQVLTSRFSHQASDTIRAIQQAAAAQFGFDWAGAPLPDRLTAHSRFRLEIDDLMTWGLGQFPFILPKRWFCRYLQGRLQETCLQELYRHAGRLKADLGDRMEEGLQRYIFALDQHVEEARRSVLAVLERAAARKQAKQLQAEKAAAEEGLNLRTLMEIDRELSSLEAEWDGARQIPAASSASPQ